MGKPENKFRKQLLESNDDNLVNMANQLDDDKLDKLRRILVDVIQIERLEKE